MQLTEDLDSDTTDTMSNSTSDETSSVEIFTAEPDGQMKEEFPEDVWNKHLWIYVSPVILVVGSIGNLLSILVFSQKGLRVKSTSVFLIMLALVDTVVLYTGLLRWWLSKLTGMDMRTLSQTGCKTHIFFTYTSIQLSSWILVAVTVERFISVYFPLKSREMCTRFTAIASCFFILLFFVCLNTHFFWTFGLHTYDNSTNYCHPQEEYMGFLNDGWHWIDAFAASYVPFIVMLISNIAIIGKIVQAKFIRQSTMNVTRGVSTKTASLTAMLLTLNFIFLLTTSPIVIFLSFNSYFLDDQNAQSLARGQLAYVILTLFMYCNNALNFFLYCISGARFRRELAALLCRRRQLRPQGSQMRSSVFTKSETCDASIASQPISSTKADTAL